MGQMEDIISVPAWRKSVCEQLEPAKCANPASRHTLAAASASQEPGRFPDTHHLNLHLVMENAPAASVKTVLLVDDRDDSRITTKWFLANFGYAVDSVRSAEEALALFDPRVHDIVVTDNSMPGMTGGEMAHVIKLRSPSTPVLMYTGRPPADCSRLDSVIQRPAHLLVVKDSMDQLLAARDKGAALRLPAC
jgi:CheY-like chemotaxis protein